jgi:hypothetical protein
MMPPTSSTPIGRTRGSRTLTVLVTTTILVLRRLVFLAVPTRRRRIPIAATPTATLRPMGRRRWSTTRIAVTSRGSSSPVVSPILSTVGRSCHVSTRRHGRRPRRSGRVMIGGRRGAAPIVTAGWTAFVRRRSTRTAAYLFRLGALGTPFFRRGRGCRRHVTVEFIWQLSVRTTRSVDAFNSYPDAPNPSSASFSRTMQANRSACL